MAAYQQPSRSERARGAALAIGVQAVIGYALFTGLAMHMPGVVEDGLAVFAVAPAPPPPPPPREKTKPNPVRSKKPEGAAAPPNLRSKATQVVAPKPIVIPPPVPPPIPVAEKAGVGSDATSGNADIVGPGTGAGGVGNGTGSGRNGDGDGDGGDYTAPVQIRGKLKTSDFPDEAGDRNRTKPVTVDYVVLPNGRVTECEVRHSSGSALLDTTTCRLIEARFRFRPSRDPSGRAIESVVTESHGWSEEIVPAEPGPPVVERRRGFRF